MHKKMLTTRQVLEKKLGAERAEAFINGIREIHKRSIFYGGIHGRSAMKQRHDTLTAGRR